MFSNSNVNLYPLSSLWLLESSVEILCAFSSANECTGQWILRKCVCLSSVWGQDQSSAVLQRHPCSWPFRKVCCCKHVLPAGKALLWPMQETVSFLPLNLPLSKTVFPLHTYTPLLVFFLIDCGNINKLLRIHIVSELKLELFICIQAHVFVCYSSFAF